MIAPCPKIGVIKWSEADSPRPAYTARTEWDKLLIKDAAALVVKPDESMWLVTKVHKTSSSGVIDITLEPVGKLAADKGGSHKMDLGAEADIDLVFTNFFGGKCELAADVPIWVASPFKVVPETENDVHFGVARDASCKDWQVLRLYLPPPFARWCVVETVLGHAVKGEMLHECLFGGEREFN